MTIKELNVLFTVYDFLCKCTSLEQAKRELEAYVGNATFNEISEMDAMFNALFNGDESCKSLF